MNHLGEVGQGRGAAGRNLAVGEENEHVADGVIDGGAGLEVTDGAKNFLGDRWIERVVERAKFEPGVVNAQFRMICGAKQLGVGVGTFHRGTQH